MAEPSCSPVEVPPGEVPRELRPVYIGLAGVSFQLKPRPEWPWGSPLLCSVSPCENFM